MTAVPASLPSWVRVFDPTAGAWAYVNNATLAQAVQQTNGRVLLEASGNMSAARIAQLKEFGLDRVSMGGLVHQARWVDLSMKMA